MARDVPRGSLLRPFIYFEVHVGFLLRSAHPLDGFVLRHRHFDVLDVALVAGTLMHQLQDDVGLRRPVIPRHGLDDAGQCHDDALLPTQHLLERVGVESAITAVTQPGPDDYRGPLCESKAFPALTSGIPLGTRRPVELPQIRFERVSGIEQRANEPIADQSAPRNCWPESSCTHRLPLTTGLDRDPQRVLGDIRSPISSA